MHDLPRLDRTSGSRRPIYLDYHATTPIDPRVAKVVHECSLSVIGNANSEHAFGEEASAVVRRARDEVGRLVGARSSCVIFTSGATESSNLAIQGFARRLTQVHERRAKIAVATVEHAAVVEVCQRLAREGGAEVVEIPVDGAGRVDTETFSRICQSGVDLACVMAANNEIGTIYPLSQLAAIAKQFGVRFLTDGAQAAGKIEIAFEEWGLDFLTVSAHKMYGPKGVGALVVASKESMSPILFGGSQEHGLRPGTTSISTIAGFGEACRLRREEMVADERETACLRDRLESLLRTSVPELVVNGDRGHRLAGNLHVSVPGAPGSAIVARLNHAVAISTGAACSSGIEGHSHVLRAIGLSEDLAEGCLRIGVGKFTTDGEVTLAATFISEAAREVRAAVCRG
jgi:cysteine desulfurase